MLTEFRDFIARGNVLDLAIAVIIGAAFATITASLTDDIINDTTHRTAMRWFQYDPFAHIAKDQATVGALRKQAEGHDIAIRSMGRGRMEHEDVNIAELSKTATGR